MKKVDLIKKINEFLSSVFESDSKAVELKQFTLEDGTIVEYENLEVGTAIFTVVEEVQTVLPDGEYVIANMKVTILEGVISEAVEIPTEEVVPVEPTLSKEELSKQMKDDMAVTLKAEYDLKLEEAKTVLEKEYKDKFDAEKERIKLELEKLSKEVQKSSLVQAPIEIETKTVPLTLKEVMLKEIDEKLKDKNN